MKVYWFSFSNEGSNVGVCLIEAESPIEAKEKIANLKLVPEYDDVLCYEGGDMSQEANLDFNILYSPEEMIALGYNITRT